MWIIEGTPPARTGGMPRPVLARKFQMNPSYDFWHPDWIMTIAVYATRAEAEEDQKKVQSMKPGWLIEVTRYVAPQDLVD